MLTVLNITLGQSKKKNGVGGVVFLLGEEGKQSRGAEHLDVGIRGLYPSTVVPVLSVPFNL